MTTAWHCYFRVTQAEMGQSASSPDANLTDTYFLELAAKEGNLDILSLFLQKNAALVFKNTADHEKNTIWHHLSRKGPHEALELLISTVNANQNKANAVPLRKYLNGVNGKGQTPLMLACEGGHDKSVHVLIAAGADVWQIDSNGRTCLHSAALRGHRACVKLVLSRATQNPQTKLPDYDSLKR